jgi:hypothetical protein
VETCHVEFLENSKVSGSNTSFNYDFQEVQEAGGETF